jgi:hypothetical protein
MHGTCANVTSFISIRKERKCALPCAESHETADYSAVGLLCAPEDNPEKASGADRDSDWQSRSD